MALEDNARDLALNAITGGITHLGLHDGFPATSGNEESGGSYARKAVSWAAITGSGTRTAAITAAVTFDVNAGTISSIGAWSALTVGTLRGGADVTDEVFAGTGQYQVTAFSISVT